MGTATGFALFTAAGAFNNSGPTVVQGNIGTQVGAFSGFPQGTVTGSINVANTYAGQVATDVATAYTYLTTSVPCGTTAISTLGGSPAQTLLPGVYCLGGAQTLTDQLILDGGGKANAVFIFKLGGALTTADLSTITLINGANADNVYWQIGGRVDLGANSVFRGTIVADGAINLISGAALLGRGLSIAGAISLDTNIVTGPLVEAPLPVTLVTFSATKQGRAVLLQWSTASESHTQDFTPERSTTGTTGWEPVGTLPAAGSSSTLRQYRMADNGERHQACYYRLRSTDTDGTFSFSPVRFVAFDDTAAPLAAFPNPAANFVVVTGAAPGSTLTLVNMAGKIWQQPSATENGVNYLEVRNILPGTYLLKAVSATGEVTSTKLVKE
ncbi:hypothetical protein GCM10028824_37770 [Hymenobacter segetis]